MISGQLYRIHDFAQKCGNKPCECRHCGCIPLQENEDAVYWNELGWGIFGTVNSFEGRRTNSRLSEINAWFVEIDGDKDQVEQKIHRASFYPSKIIETKNGYHLYFLANDAKQNTYEEIQERLSHFYGGDPRAKDLARVLRVPGFVHWKDPNDPFVIKEISNFALRFNEKQMLHHFPPLIGENEIFDFGDFVPPEGDSLTEKLNSLNNLQALEILSGSSSVRSEVYKFRRNFNGKWNILVNSKSTSCFIDSHYRIGAIPGGPTVWQWLRYFGHSDKMIHQILTEKGIL